MEIGVEEHDDDVRF